MKTETQDIKVVTWNILAQAYIRPERYQGVDPAALTQGPRQTRMLRILAELDADLLLLQEVEPHAFEAICAALPGHHGVYEGKRGKPDGLATLHRPDRLELRRTQPLHYRASDPGYDHLALVSELEHRGHLLRVGNTHLRWQPRETPAHLHQGLLQLQELLALMGRDPAARLIAGDLNALSSGPVIKAAQAAGLQLAARSLRPWDTALINGNRRKLDYLLHGPQLRASPHPLAPLSKHRPIPCYDNPSDHLPLRVDFTWC